MHDDAQPKLETTSPTTITYGTSEENPIIIDDEPSETKTTEDKATSMHQEGNTEHHCPRPSQDILDNCESLAPPYPIMSDEALELWLADVRDEPVKKSKRRHSAMKMIIGLCSSVYCLYSIVLIFFPDFLMIVWNMKPLIEVKWKKYIEGMSCVIHVSEGTQKTHD